MAPIITSPGLGRTAGSPREQTCVLGVGWGRGGSEGLNGEPFSAYFTTQAVGVFQEALAASCDGLKAEYWREAPALWRQQRQTTHQPLMPTSKGPRSLLSALSPLSTAPSIFRSPVALTWPPGHSLEDCLPSAPSLFWVHIHCLRLVSMPLPPPPGEGPTASASHGALFLVPVPICS